LISLYPDYPSDVCIVLTNTSSGEAAVTMNVVGVGKNNAGEDSCKSSLDVTPFSESILSDADLQLFTIPAGKSVVRSIPFLVHDNFTGAKR